MKENLDLLVKTSPQIHNRESTGKIMWTVTLCLVPAGIWGIYVFGMRALVVVLVSIAAACAGEYAIARAQGKFTLLDGSAFLTGILVGYNMPPGVPLFIPVIASLFAIAVVKWSFGGLGANWMNPALGGRVFVFFSWTGPMTVWNIPKTISGADAVTGPSVLGSLKAGLVDLQGSFSGPLEFLNMNGFPHTAFDGRATQWLNNAVFSGGNVGNGYFDLFFGNVPGCIGEVSAFLLILGSIYLFIKKIITWEIPITYLGTFGVLTWIFGGLSLGSGFFSGDVVFHLFSGGLILGALYMATDMVTSPITRKGMIWFGVGVGFFTFLIRTYGSFPEGVSLAIILMNIFVPLINRITKTERFGVEKKGQEA